MPKKQFDQNKYSTPRQDYKTDHKPEYRQDSYPRPEKKQADFERREPISAPHFPEKKEPIKQEYKKEFLPRPPVVKVDQPFKKAFSNLSVEKTPVENHTTLNKDVQNNIPRPVVPPVHLDTLKYSNPLLEKKKEEAKKNVDDLKSLLSTFVKKEVVAPAQVPPQPQLKPEPAVVKEEKKDEAKKVEEVKTSNEATPEELQKVLGQ
jgi:hypothetical protein